MQMTFMDAKFRCHRRHAYEDEGFTEYHRIELVLVKERDVDTIARVIDHNYKFPDDAAKEVEHSETFSQSWGNLYNALADFSERVSLYLAAWEELEPVDKIPSEQ